MKGQAAMEFLMTYGWAIMVCLIAIGALAYFGVLNPNAVREAQIHCLCSSECSIDSDEGHIIISCCYESVWNNATRSCDDKYQRVILDSYESVNVI